MTEYEYEYYSSSKKWPNTNIIWLPKKDWIQIRISFSFQNWLNTNENIIWFPKKIKYKIPKGGNNKWRKEISTLTVSMLHSIVVNDMQLFLLDPFRRWQNPNLKIPSEMQVAPSYTLLTLLTLFALCLQCFTLPRY